MSKSLGLYLRKKYNGALWLDWLSIDTPAHFRIPLLQISSDFSLELALMYKREELVSSECTKIYILLLYVLSYIALLMIVFADNYGTIYTSVF